MAAEKKEPIEVDSDEEEEKVKEPGISFKNIH
jgi:hypothetical protein